MSIREGDVLKPHRLGRGLLLGLLVVLTGLVAAGLLWVLSWLWYVECNGSDASELPMPGSGQVRMCQAWGGNVGVLFWLSAGLGLAIALAVGLSWMRGRIHGAWVIAATALVAVGPIVVWLVLSSPSGVADRPAEHERSLDGTGRR